MSTNDVPGARPANRDQLAMGCWAEHEDGSLILVESTEGGRTIYSIFDVDKDPITEYRDAMNEGAFKQAFSWAPGKSKDERWTWHDKTAFPWDRIIRDGARDGVRHASADDLLTAAERVRRSRELHAGRAVDADEIATRMDKIGERVSGRILTALQRAIDRLPARSGAKRRAR